LGSVVGSFVTGKALYNDFRIFIYEYAHFV
jgi:hypothetical protein